MEGLHFLLVKYHILLAQPVSHLLVCKIALSLLLGLQKYSEHEIYFVMDVRNGEG